MRRMLAEVDSYELAEWRAFVRWENDELGARGRGRSSVPRSTGKTRDQVYRDELPDDLMHATGPR